MFWVWGLVSWCRREEVVGLDGTETYLCFGCWVVIDVSQTVKDSQYYEVSWLCVEERTRAVGTKVEVEVEEKNRRRRGEISRNTRNTTVRGFTRLVALQARLSVTLELILPSELCRSG